VKAVIWVAVCAALAGCPSKPKPDPSPVPPSNQPALCLPVQATRIAGGAASLIRARVGWLLELGPGCGLDLQAMRGAVALCGGPQGCGIALDRPEIEALAGELAQAPVERLTVAGGPAVSYQLGSRTVFRFGRDRKIEDVLGHFAAQPPPGRPGGAEAPTHAVPAGARPAVGPAIPCCPGCGRCAPGQCEAPPPPPPRFADFESCDCDAVCAARKNGPLPVDCACDRECPTCP
jgi:hypothetical protein